MQNRYDLVDLKVFLAISQEENLSAGAEKCHLSVSAVSLRMKNLESAVGTSLFIRKSRGMELTRAGQILASHAKACLEQLEHMHAELMPFGEGLAGQVTLFANNNAISSYLPEDLGHFFISYPKVRVNLEEHLSHDILSAISSGRADVGIGVFPNEADHEGLKFTSYRQDHLVVLAPKDSKYSYRSSITFNECLLEPFICLQKDAALHSYLVGHATALNAKLDIRVQVSGFVGVARLISAGAGIGVVPESTLEYVDISNLHILKLDEPWAPRDLKICYKKTSAEKTNPFLARLVEELERKTGSRQPG